MLLKFKLTQSESSQHFKCRSAGTLLAHACTNQPLPAACNDANDMNAIAAWSCMQIRKREEAAAHAAAQKHLLALQASGSGASRGSAQLTWNKASEYSG